MMRLFRVFQVCRPVRRGPQVRHVLERRPVRRLQPLPFGREVRARPSGVLVHVEEVLRPIQMW